MKEKISSYMGFAAKSRNLVNGYNTCLFTMNKRKIKLMIIAVDLSENSAEKIVRAAETRGVTYRRYGTVDELSQMTGNTGVGIYGITDQNFANVILKEIDESGSVEKEVF